MIVRTQIADAGRVADGVANTTRGTVYVRVAVGKTCGRCLVLAGRVYGWNKGFARHPRCDCKHLPSDRRHGHGLITDPRKAFDEMSRAEQDKRFGRAGAEAIRSGADIGQIVNARRGMSTTVDSAGRRQQATERIFGRDLAITREGITRFGIAGQRLGTSSRGIRLMPEEIYRLSGGDREQAIRLLKRYGYLI